MHGEMTYAIKVILVPFVKVVIYMQLNGASLGLMVLHIDVQNVANWTFRW